jgi:carboxymethylenebutenolidase
MTAARSLTDAMVIEDTRALIQFLDSGQATAARPMACIGYCMGGRHAIRVAAAFTDRFKATASLHGTELVTDHPDSAHLDAQKVTGELYCAYAERDPHGSERVRTVMAEAMKSGRARYIAGFHENAEHGYAIPDRDVYLKDATDRDWQEFFSMIGRMSAA